MACRLGGQTIDKVVGLESGALIRQRIEDSVAVKHGLLEQVSTLNKVAQEVIKALQVGRKVLLFGNGGSAADAQHIAAEFMGRYYVDRRPFPAEALTVNTSILTAIANDYSFEQVFARQVEALGEEGDVAIGITTSGNSPNVIAGIRAARRKMMFTVGLTGAGGGLLVSEVDYCICVPSRDTPRVQEVHIFIGHVLCEIVERALVEDKG